MIYLVETELVGASSAKISFENLSDASSRHLRALRPDVKEEICLLDLRGNYSLYKVAQLRPFEAVLIEKKFEETANPAIHLMMAPPLGSALEQAVEQVTEMGIDAIHFVRSERVQYMKNKELPQQRLQRVVEASCKQCGRKWSPLLDFSWWNLSDEKLAGFQIFFADEGAAQKKWGLLKTAAKDKKDRALFIGPEGGWSPAERTWLQQHGTPLSLGPYILRVPTAVVSAYTLLMKEFG